MIWPCKLVSVAPLRCVRCMRTHFAWKACIGDLLPQDRSVLDRGKPTLFMGSGHAKNGSVVAPFTLRHSHFALRTSHFTVERSSSRGEPNQTKSEVFRVVQTRTTKFEVGGGFRVRSSNDEVRSSKVAPCSKFERRSSKFESGSLSEVRTTKFEVRKWLPVRSSNDEVRSSKVVPFALRHSHFALHRNSLQTPGNRTRPSRRFSGSSRPERRSSKFESGSLRTSHFALRTSPELSSTSGEHMLQMSPELARRQRKFSTSIRSLPVRSNAV